MPEKLYDINEKCHAIFRVINDKGEETMKYEHPQIDILRLSNLLQIFTAGRYDTDVRMTVDIAFPAPAEELCPHGIHKTRQCSECSNEHPSLP